MNKLDELGEECRTRINEWVQQKSVWYQLLHGSGWGGSSLLLWRRVLVRSVVGLILFAGLLAIGAHKYYNSSYFLKGEKDRWQAAMNAEGIKISGQDYVLGRGHISLAKLDAKGGSGAFYELIKIREIKLPFGVVTGVFPASGSKKVWIRSVEGLVKCGERDSKSAKAAFDGLFGGGWENIEEVEVEHCGIFFGYSDATKGWIEDSALKLVRDAAAGGWRLALHGGKMHWGPLKEWNLQKLDAKVTREGVEIERARLVRGDACIEISGKFGEGDMPEFTGQVTMERVKWVDIFPLGYDLYFDGRLQARGTISGSLNSPKGLLLALRATLNADNPLVMNSRMALVQCLSALGLSDRHQAITFDKGGMEFDVRVGGDCGVELRDMDLGNDRVAIGGNLRVRLPSQEERRDDFQAFVEGERQIGVGSSIQDVRLGEMKMLRQWDRVVDEIDFDGSWGLERRDGAKAKKMSAAEAIEPRIVKEMRESFRLLEAGMRRYEAKVDVHVREASAAERFAYFPRFVRGGKNGEECVIRIEATDSLVDEIGKDQLPDIISSTSLRAWEARERGASPR